MPIESTIVGTSKDDLDFSLLISTDSGGIAVNLPGLYQRNLNEYRLRMTKIKNIFYTHISSSTIEGSIGMILTLATSARSAQTETEFVTKKMYSPIEPQFLDNFGKSCVDDGVWVNCAYNSYNLGEFYRIFPDTTVCTFKTTVDKMYCGYIFNFDPLPGKFNVGKAKELGIPAGPLFNKLKKGQSIELQDGRIINPEEVVGASIQNGSIVIFPECVDTTNSVDFSCLDTYFYTPAPSVMYISYSTINSLTFNTAGSNSLKLFIQKFLSMNKLNKILCYGPKYNKNLPKIIQTTIKFPPVFRSFATRRKICVGNMFCSNIPIEWEAPQDRCNEEEKSLIDEDNKITNFNSFIKEGAIIVTEPVCTFKLSPEKIAGTLEHNFNCDSTKYCEEYIKDHPINEKSVEQIKELLSMMKADNNSNKPKLSILGTGASMPSKYRNVSGYLLSCNGSYIIVDCGEGTYIQMVRMYGEEYVNKEILPNISHIFITHDHADHFLGVINIMFKFLQIAMCINKKVSLEIYVPDFVINIINAAKDLVLNGIMKSIAYAFDNFIKIYTIKKVRPHFSTDYISVPNMGAFVNAVRVPHTEKSYGFIVNFPHKEINEIYLFGGDGYTYISLVEGIERAFSMFFKNVNTNETHITTVLENTFAKGLEMDAFQKRHSTTLDAFIAAKILTANTLVLSHMSQRYQKIAPRELFDYDIADILGNSKKDEELNTNENEVVDQDIGKKFMEDFTVCNDGCRINVDISGCDNIVSMGLRIKKGNKSIAYTSFPSPFPEDRRQEEQRIITLKRETLLNSLVKNDTFDEEFTEKSFPQNIIWAEDLIAINKENAKFMSKLTNIISTVFVDEAMD